MRASVLGSARLESSAGPVPFPKGKLGTLLGRLLVAPNRIHSHDSLVDFLWPGETNVSEKAKKARLQVVVSRLRAFLESSDDRRIDLIADDGGYGIRADASCLDTIRFENLARRVLLGDESRLQSALRVWRGEPFSGLQVTPELSAARARLVDLHRTLEGMHRRAHAGAMPTPKAFAHTKFLPPAVDTSSIIRRSRLLERMGRVGEIRAIVVSAPAGYGKSVLLSQWSGQQELPVAWATIDPQDQDPNRFWAAIAQALGGIEAIDLTALPEAAPGSRQFFEALTDLLTHRSIGLVLDDYHYVGSERSRALAGVLSVLPASVTVAVGTREPVSAPDMAGEVRALGAVDLSFSQHDVVTLSDALDTGEPSKGAIENLVTMTEGWPIAISHLVRRGVKDVDRVANTDLHAYVVEEVVEELPDEVRGFLFESALLEWVNASLCDAATGRTDASRIISWLRERDLFLIGAQPDTGWYRYHSLVTDALRRRAEVEPDIDSASILRRAAGWCHENELDELALEYALRGDDSRRVASLAGPVAASRAQRGEIHSVRSLLGDIDPVVVIADRAGHDTLMFFVAAWLSPEAAQKWIESRKRYLQASDIPVMLVEAHQLLVQAQLERTLRLNEEIRAVAPSYFAAHPSSGELAPIVEMTMDMASLCARIMAGRVRHDDAELTEAVRTSQGYGPAASVWLLGEWAFLAYVEGNPRTASSLVRRAEAEVSVLDRVSVELGAPRMLATKALLDSDRSMDPGRQQSISERLEPLVRQYESLGWYTDLIPVLLALHVVSYRAADFEAAFRYITRVDLLLDDCGEAELFVRARNLLYQSMGERDGLAPIGGLATLTEQQRTVLKLLAEGLTYRRIAETLEVGIGSVRASIRSVYQKLGVHNRYDAVDAFEARQPDRADT